MIKFKDCHKKFKGCFIGLIAMTSSGCIAQPSWTEQPVFFSVGLTIGFSVKSHKPGKLALLVGTSKIASDFNAGRVPDLSSVTIGAWMGASIRQDLKTKQRKYDNTRTKAIR